MVHRRHRVRGLRVPPVGRHPTRPRHDRRSRRAHGRRGGQRRGGTRGIRERGAAHRRGALRRRRGHQRHRRPRLVHVQAPWAPDDDRGRAAPPHDPHRRRLRVPQQHPGGGGDDPHRPAVGGEHSHTEGAGHDPAVVRVHLGRHVHFNRHVYQPGGAGHVEGLEGLGRLVGDEAVHGALRPRSLRRSRGDDGPHVHAHRVQGVASRG
mmetsp:Transcript_11113/g.43322  ORF Transcript_11113/g.43322 Transcript_11113/m.43322 type:complete len:207 (+) Transcript_11113:292-912(+)